MSDSLFTFGFVWLRVKNRFEARLKENVGRDIWKIFFIFHYRFFLNFFYLVMDLIYIPSLEFREFEKFEKKKKHTNLSTISNPPCKKKRSITKSAGNSKPTANLTIISQVRGKRPNNTLTLNAGNKGTMGQTSDNIR